MKTHQITRLRWLLAIGFLSLFTTPTTAQNSPIAPANDGTNTQINQQGSRIDISGRCRKVRLFRFYLYRNC